MALRKIILPDPPPRYDQRDQARIRRYLEQYTREVQAQVTALQDAIDALDDRVTDLE